MLRSPGPIALALLLALACAAQATPREQPLFDYQEGADVVSYWPPKTVRLVWHKQGGKTKVCESELPDNGNMWTGPEVEAAFRNREVQRSLRTTKAPYRADTAGKLTAAHGTITWATTCDKCLAPPAGVQQLHTVMRTVMLNRRLLCEESAP